MKTRAKSNPRPSKSRRRFPARVLSLLRDSRILRVRAGDEAHRFTGIWVVVVNGRVFVRPWNDKPSGWHRAFLREVSGTIAIADREIGVRARRAGGERLWDAVDSAYAEKYDTKASLQWVRGLATPRRRKTTTELLPR
jgi:hypothetical protein